ncbi:hypothetical protein [Devosia sp. 66-22]|uniref:hypothetical protein n=1 Tax=Devosia sp. 66-22 TaxID=1895753 RepID=UPI0009262484|nr:hypothetical protein [Devosia sp. 66-22]OJX46374.1 MAG: hypothetical protein BGO81_03120 [Devosia sp. 66-22]
MQRLIAVSVFVAALLVAGGAAAQSLSPMRAAGDTPSDIKGFRPTIGNPYTTSMIFIVTPMNPEFTEPVGGAVVTAPELRLAPGASRPVIVKFKIDPAFKERTIGVCVQPKDLEGPILPRVCGTYVGRRLSARG